ncbi:hypothetical protein GCM10011351_14400 [Paraliobacillus quinghaiensis]|uniref:Uncharacterized protein n=1 Tax=Paraliobacillus quinghaiensis TaxID=470815 RepID=A0A917WUB6_9BACI|nr:hypothetical protein [Paraliobacillus quinghaiensis]GGM29392.1 hypothetical protein GCM10011351_14400 [Paraliobacillus quinghaiensis]
MNILNGIIAAALAFTGGAGLSLFSEEDTNNPNTTIQERDVRNDEVRDMMGTRDLESMQTFMEEDNVNFDEMQRFMEEENVDFDEMQRFIEEENVDFDEMQRFMEEGNVDFDEMQKFMEEGNVNFGQMKPYMSEMHPNLDDQELNEWYKGMHGTGGSSQSSNFRGMGSMH